MRIVLSLVLGMFVYICNGQNVDIIPVPMRVELQKDLFFELSKSTTINYSAGEDEKSANLFNDYLQKMFGYRLSTKKIPDGNSLKNTIFFIGGDQKSEPGAYKVVIAPTLITISGGNEGVFYGAMSLLQLMQPQANLASHKIPVGLIDDKPRFNYRGMHFDVSRHFSDINFVKKYIDYLAYHKMNVFHWHLTDDQGWRIDIKKYPKLTEIGGFRNGTIIGRYPGTGNDNKPYGGFYTQEQIKEVVQYAADRHITVIPEIELPGHASAAIAAYPFLSCFPDQKTFIPDHMSSEASKKATGKLVQETWGVFDDVFCAGKESTFEFFQNVFDEVITLFPSKYVHIGGDECPKTHWKKCPLCQKRMKDLGLKDEHELQSYFIQRIEKYLNSKGKTIIGWDEILEGGLAPNAVVMSWRGEEGGIEAANHDHYVIMTPQKPVYFDHTQSRNEDSVTIGGYNPIEQVYAYEPVPKALDAGKEKYVLGAQANLWTEYIKNPSKVEYMLFPRMSALSEVLWSEKGNKSAEDFERRLLTQFRRYDLLGVNYSTAYFNITPAIQASSRGDGLMWTLRSKSKTKKIVITKPGAPPAVINQVLIPNKKLNDSITYTAELLDVTYDKNGKANINWNTRADKVTQKFFFNKATGKKITLLTRSSPNYPGDGPFTLINGVRNQKGLAASNEILGFSGEDVEVIIDLMKPESVSKIIVHAVSQGGSWVYPPSSVEVFTSSDGKKFQSRGITTAFNIIAGSNGVLEVSFTAHQARYIKVLVKNLGIVPEGKPGAGNKAWLFVDEIDIY